MSLDQAAHRDLIVRQLATLPGLAANPSWPAPVVAGSAWPVWLSTQWVTESIIRSRWFVYVVLPAGNQQTTVSASDEAVMVVGAVLWPIGQIQNSEPAAVPAEQGGATLPAVLFTLEI